MLYLSKVKIRFQSFLMLITFQPLVLASSYSACVNVPTLVSGRPLAGPYAYSRARSSCETNIVNHEPSLAWVQRTLERARPGIASE